jgi:hypothetical protein
MRLCEFNISEQEDKIKISVMVDSSKLGRKELWFSTPKIFGECLCKNRMDGFLVGMLFPAMQYGEDIHADGCVSEKLLFNINNYVVPLLMAFSPSCRSIKVSSGEVSSERFDCNGVGTGFSAGVDSFCTIYDRLELERSPNYKVNSFLFLNVGSHGWGESAEMQALAKKKFSNRYDYLKKFPESLGLDFIPMDSNLHTFHPWGHQKTHTLTSVAGVLMLQARYRRYYYASSGVDYGDMLRNAREYRDVDVGEFCDPILLPLLSTESLEFVADGVQYTRIQKTLRIMNYKPVKKYLNVCINLTDTYKNCSVCAKCCRTLMTLTSAGIVDQFDDLFDIDKYNKKAKLRYLASQVLLEKKDPFARGNVELAHANGMILPGHVMSIFISAWYSIKNFFLRNFFLAIKAILPASIISLLKKRMRGNSL